MEQVNLSSNLDYAVVCRSLNQNRIWVEGYFRFWQDAARWAAEQSKEQVFDYAVIERDGSQAYYRCGVRKINLVMPAVIMWEEV